MSFPTRLLGPGEEVHLDSRPNWSYLFWPSVFTVLVLAGCVATVVLWTSAPLVAGWVLLGVGLAALAYLGARYLGWRTTTFVVTSQRIVYRTGVLRRTGREIPIGRVQDVTYHQSVVERIVRAGSLTVESAGRQGQDPFPDISRPDEVQSLINRVVAQSLGGYPAAQVSDRRLSGLRMRNRLRHRACTQHHRSPIRRRLSRSHGSWDRCRAPRRRRPSPSSLASWRSCTSTASSPMPSTSRSVGSYLTGSEDSKRAAPRHWYAS